MAVCPTCMNPFPPGKEPDICPRCGTVLHPENISDETPPPPQNHVPPPLTKEEKQKQKREKRAARKQAFKAKTAKLNPKRLRAPKIKKVRDPTMMVKQARARFFMIIAGFIITIMVFVHIFRNINRYVNKFSGGKNKHTEQSSSAAATPITGARNRPGVSSPTISVTALNTGNSDHAAGSTVLPPSNNTRISTGTHVPKPSNGTGGDGAAKHETETGTAVAPASDKSKAANGKTASSSSGNARSGADAVNADTEKRIKTLKTLFFKQQYQSCIDLADRILLDDPDNFEAQNYKNMATQVLKARRERGQL